MLVVLEILTFAPALTPQGCKCQNRTTSAILSAPGWARVGITAPKPCLREDAANALARAIVDWVGTPPGGVADAQIDLPLQR